MSMTLVHTNRDIDQDARAKADWAAITAVSAADAASPYPGEGYVHVSAAAVAAAAALLDDAAMTNGQAVTTYDFGRDGAQDAHVNGFGPALLRDGDMAALRAILAPFPGATAMLDVAVERHLQVSLSTSDRAGRPCPHLKGINWAADDVEINRCGGNMTAMLRDLGLEVGRGAGEVGFDAFARAVEENAENTDYPADRLRAFVACGRRQGATHVHWA